MPARHLRCCIHFEYALMQFASVLHAAGDIAAAAAQAMSLLRSSKTAHRVPSSSAADQPTFATCG
jgi:hypothetical protein